MSETLVPEEVNSQNNKKHPVAPAFFRREDLMSWFDINANHYAEWRRTGVIPDPDLKSPDRWYIKKITNHFDRLTGLTE